MSKLFGADLKTLWLLGNPVSHSLSPLIQNTALAYLGEPAIYVAAAVAEADVATAIQGLAALGALGANVTVPHKEAAFRACHEVSERARAMGACNVLKFKDGKILGDNTDGAGWLRGLDQELGGTLPGKAVVIGAGGAARAIVYSLATRGVPEVVVLNRTVERAQELAKDFSGYPGTRIAAGRLEDFLSQVLPGCLVVQTTSAGLERESPLDLPQAWPSKAVLSELIYGRETPLATAVRGLGGTVHDGLPMLIYQAAESLSIWLDRPLEEIPAALMLETARQHLASR